MQNEFVQKELNESQQNELLQKKLFDPEQDVLFVGGLAPPKIVAANSSCKSVIPVLPSFPNIE